MVKKKNTNTNFRTLGYFWRTLMQFKARSILLLLIIPIHVFLGAIIVPLCASNIIGELATGNTNFDSYIPLLAGYVGALVARIILVRIIDWTDWSLDAKGGYYLSQLSFNKLTEESMTFYNNHFAGSLTSQANKLTNSFIRLKSSFTWSIYPLILSVIFTISTIWTISPLYAVVLLGFVFAFIGAAIIVFSRTRKVEERLPKAESKQTGMLADALTNILNIKSFAREKYERDRYDKSCREVHDATMVMAKTSFWRNNVLNILSTGIVIVMIFLIVNGHEVFGFTVANIVLIYNLTMDICSRIWDTSSILRDINRSFGDAKEMVEILETPTSVVDRNDKELVVKTASIDFHNISFKHAEQNDTLFQDFSLQIQPGERIGLVGISGSGKSTLTKLLLRFSDLKDGRILIDGQDIAEVTQNSLHRAIAYVPQESVLFHRSIAENIAYGKPGATHEEIVHAAKLASADEFIAKLPDGYNTMVGERGAKLSGGQRQRIAIARAILKDAPILVLDEATSALDSESEALIQKSMGRLMKDRTSIVVAHRLSTIASLDRIIVLKDGKIIEQGSHHQLLCHDGPYKKLWNRQSGAMLEAEPGEDATTAED